MKVKEMATRCELAMMGKVVECKNNEVQAMTEYIIKAVKGEDYKFTLCNIVEESINRYQKNEVKYLVCNKVHGMPCITYLLESQSDDEEDLYPAPFEEDYGTGHPCAFCYVFNLDNDWCSEFGDCFFEKKSDGFYHRVG